MSYVPFSAEDSEVIDGTSSCKLEKSKDREYGQDIKKLNGDKCSAMTRIRQNFTEEKKLALLHMSKHNK